MLNKIFVHYQLPEFYRSTRIEIYEQSFVEIKNFIKLLRSQGYKNKIIFILNHVWEITNQSDLIFLQKFFKKKFMKYKIDFFLLYSTCDNKKMLPDNVIEYNFFQNKTVYASTANNQQTSTSWNRSKFKGLLLTGKSNKIQRLLPLTYLLDRNLLNEEYIEWSFFYIEKNKSDIKKILNLNEEEFQNFLSIVLRTPDNINFVTKLIEDSNELTHKEEFYYDGFPYDCNLYKNTSWSLISETSSELGAHFITEKTYRAIINKHPFIFFGQFHTEKFLRECGYRTFDYCYPYQYDTIKDVKDRIAAGIENVKFLKENWKKLDFDRINIDIEYNYKILFEKMSKSQTELIKNLKFTDGDLLCDVMNYNIEGMLQNTIKDIVEGKTHIVYYNWF
jgi:hypothetical protein